MHTHIRPRRVHDFVSSIFDYELDRQALDSTHGHVVPDLVDGDGGAELGVAHRALGSTDDSVAAALLRLGGIRPASERGQGVAGADPLVRNECYYGRWSRTVS